MFSNTTIGKALTAGAGMAMLAAMLPLAAGAAPPGSRIEKQQQRLNQGVKSGQVTQGEYNRREAKLNQINAQRKADLAANGGHLTSAEKSQLGQELGQSSRGINFSKHNDTTRPGTAPDSHKTLPGLPPKGSPGYVGARLDRERDRIMNGEANGSLTRAEYGADMAKLSAIRQQQQTWMKAQNGSLTAAQQQTIDTELNAEGGKIYNTKHNAQGQPGY